MLRYLLARPVGRTRLLVAKLISLIVFVAVAVLVVVDQRLPHRHALFGSRPPPGGDLAVGPAAAEPAAGCRCGSLRRWRTWRSRCSASRRSRCSSPP